MGVAQEGMEVQEEAAQTQWHNIINNVSQN